MNVRLKPSAEADVKGIQVWHRERGVARGRAFRDALDNCLASVAHNPHAYPCVHGPLRRALLRRFPYAVFYLTTDDEIIVFGVFHGRRDPKTWESRFDT